MLMLDINKILKLKSIIFITILFSSIFSGCITENSEPVTFDDIQNKIDLTLEDMTVVLKSVYNNLIKNNSNIEIPNNLLRDAKPRIIFLSLSTGISNADVYTGMGNGFKQALLDCFEQISNNYKQTSSLWIKIDVVQTVTEIGELNYDAPVYFDGSLQGAVFGENVEIAFLPEEIVSYDLFDDDFTLNLDNIKESLDTKGYSNESINDCFKENSFYMKRFSRSCYFYDGTEVSQLYRGHRIFYESSSDTLIKSAINGGKYLVNATKPDGTFIYNYQAKNDTETEDYNLLRHAGTIYSLCKLYEYQPNENILKSVEKTLSYLYNQTAPFGNVLCIVNDEDELKLGGAALAVIASVEYTKITGDYKYLQSMQKLAGYIKISQKENGEFIYKIIYSTGEITDFVSEFYPGEAILALCRLYTIDHDESWLDVAEKASDYLISVKDADVETNNLTHDHWLLMGLNELYRFRNKDIYLEHSMKIAESIMNKQRTQTDESLEYLDWLGSYYTPPRSTPTATRSEGLIAAYNLAKDYSTQNMADRLLNAIKLGIGFQLQTQFDPASVMYVPAPKNAIGGFHEDLTNFDIRIDYVQHNICSILGYYDILLKSK